MPTPTCASHPQQAAHYRCEECGRPLCPDCVEEGHRLLFCRHCGNRALPLDPARPATAPELRRQAAAEGPYELTDALRYPVRGLGGYLLLGYMALLAVPSLMTSGLSADAGCLGGVAGLSGCILQLIVWIVLLVLLPGLLLEIVRTTADGDNELPDWPDLGDAWARIAELAGVVLIAFLALLPTLGLLRLLGCSIEELASDRLPPRCLVAFALGLPLGVAIWVPALGATAVYQSWWLAPRVDLHVRALGFWRAEGVRTVLLVGGMLLLGELVHRFTSGLIPWLGPVLGSAIALYALFVCGHLVGLLFRRHPEAMEAIYLG